MQHGPFQNGVGKIVGCPAIAVQLNIRSQDFSCFIITNFVPDPERMPLPGHNLILIPVQTDFNRTTGCPA